jgi:hypothetical protein
MYNSINTARNTDLLVKFSEDVRNEVYGRLESSTKPQIFLGSDGDSFLVDILDGGSKNILKTIYINIGSKVEISGVEDGVVQSELNGISIDHYPGERESSIYVPDADHVMMTLNLLESTTQSPLQIMAPCGDIHNS